MGIPLRTRITRPSRDFIQQSPGGLLNDVIYDVARGVIDAPGFADFGFGFDGDAFAVRADHVAEEAFIDAAENLHVNDVEQVGRFVIAQFADESRQPFVADDMGFGEVRLEEVAVEKGNVRGWTAVERAEMPDDGRPKTRRSRGDEALTFVIIALFERQGSLSLLTSAPLFQA